MVNAYWYPQLSTKERDAERMLGCWRLVAIFKRQAYHGAV